MSAHKPTHFEGLVSLVHSGLRFRLLLFRHRLHELCVVCPNRDGPVSLFTE